MVRICLTMFSSARLLHRLWCWHLLAIQKSLALFQIMPCGVMDLAPLLCIIMAIEQPLLLLLYGLLLMISTISMVSMIPAIYSIDLLTILLLLPWWPLDT
jgi:hypothetical protein